ncbi:hypothetical protein B0H14DRAFT_3497086 [Mycena olivaceomarginata]|nr:hypothetical protein B0H14DRAFT_3497086 [Mycena olivaceomarginata]
MLRKHKIQLFNHEPELKGKPEPRLFENPPSKIIADPKGFHTFDEKRAHVCLVLQQHADLVRAGGYDRMVSFISLLNELGDCDRAAAEIARRASARAARLKAERDRIRRERKDTESHTCREEMMRTRPRPRGIRIVHRHGKREVREHPLEEDDLYLDDARPDDVWWPQLAHTCHACLNAKSHPVKIICGHSTCFVCMRLLFETQWECPQCGEKVTHRPVAHVEEAAAIERDFPGWDKSKVAYGWQGLSFPAVQRVG